MCTRIRANGLRAISGTTQSSVGYPTGITRYGRSWSGRRRIERRNFIGLGVCVSVASPAWCAAARSIPTEIPIDSSA